MNISPKYARLVRRPPEHQQNKNRHFVKSSKLKRWGLFIVASVIVISAISTGIFFFSPRGVIKGVSADGYHYQYKDGKSSFDSVSFAKSDTLLPSYRINDGDVSLAMTYSPTIVKDSYEVISDSSGSIKSLTFKGVEENTNIVYTLEGENTVKEDIELTKAPTKESLSSYTFTIELTGLTYDRNESGDVIPIFFDKKGTEYSIPPLVMKDASGKETNLVTSTISTPDPNIPNILTAIVTPDSTWLTDPLRVYPVRIDPSVVKGNAPVSYWKIDEGTGSSINDTSTNANTLSITNATWQVNGTESSNSIGKTAVRFDGSGDFLTRTYDSDFDFGTGSFSVSMWARIPPVAAGPDVLLARFAGAGFKIYMDASEFICFGIDDDSTWGPDDPACTTTAYNDGKWHHIEAVKSGTSSITLYIDGVMKKVNDATTADSTLSGSSPALYIGIDSDGSSNSFQGDIDSVSIFNYERDVNQVKADAFTKTQVSASFGGSNVDSISNGLIGFWDMNESSWTINCSTDSVLDKSGSNKHGDVCPNSTGPAAGGIGVFANGATLDGSNDEIRLLSYTFGTEVTISFWAKVNAAKATCSTTTAMATGTSAQNGFAFGDDGAGGYCNRITFKGNNSASASGTAGNLPAGQTYNWNLYTAVSNSSGLYLYVNGQLLSSNTTAFTNTTLSNATYYLGSAASYSGRFFYGTLDDVRIYNRGLSPAEVRALYDYAPGPVGYWKLDENTSTAANDSSGNGNGLTLTNTPSWVVGKYGSGVLFSGSDQHLLRADDPDFDFADDANMTVETWFKHGTASAQEVILSKYNEAGYKIIMESDGDITCALDYDATWTPTDSATSTASTYDDDVWHHIACVKTGASTLDLYIDGVLIATDASLTATNTLTNSDPLYVGINADGTSNDFTGRLDEVKIYTYARSLNQIVEDLNGGHPLGGSPVGSQALYWKMDEGYGTSLHDASRLNFTGTLACFGASCVNPSWSNAGKLGKALFFSGSGTTGSYVTTSPINNPATTGSKITISTWIKPDTTQNGNGWYLRNGTGADLNYSFYLGSTTSGGKFKVGIQRYTSTWADNSTTGYYVPESVWSHVVTVFSQGEWLKVYVNGELKETVALTDLSVVSTSTFNIGGHAGTTGQMLNGYMDEFKLYTGELTADEIKFEYNQGRATVMGAASTASDGKTPDFSSSREYCVPGDTATCTSPKLDWKFDEGNGQYGYDSSSTGNTGPLGSSSNEDTNDPSWTNGKNGRALYFDGSDNYVSIADNNTLDLTDKVTMQAWIKMPSLPNYASIMGKRDASATSANYALRTGTGGNNDELEFYYANGSWQVYTTSNANLSTNTWYFITAVYDGSSVKIYKDGVLLTGSCISGTCTTSMVADNDSFSVGRSGDLNGEYFIGIIDQVRIYDDVRTPAQIAWDYNRGRPVAHYKLDECTGSTVHSNSEIYDSNLNGTITIGGSGTQTSTGTCGSEGTTAWYNGATGKLNASLNFDGTDDSVSTAITTTNGLDVKGPISYSAWFKRANTGTYQTIVSKLDSCGGDADGFLIRFTESSNFAFEGYKNGNVFYAAYTSSTLFNDTTNWHHVLATWDGTTNANGVKLYVDGKLVVQSTSSADTFISLSWTNQTIGVLPCSAHYFAGQIDEVQTYSYALTPAQIQTIYTNGAVSFK